MMCAPASGNISRRSTRAIDRPRGTSEKGHILMNSVRSRGTTGSAAMRLLNQPPARRRAAAAPPAADHATAPSTIHALTLDLGRPGYPWSVRLKALLPLWLPWARKRLAAVARDGAAAAGISARQIDRLLAPESAQLASRLYGRTKPGTLLKHHIPIKTDHWDVTEPGFTEVDLVAHSGDRADGEFAHSLNLTDIHTTWVEPRGPGKGPERACRQALEDIRQALPFRAARHRLRQRLRVHQCASEATARRTRSSSRGGGPTRRTTTRTSSRRTGRTCASCGYRPL